MISRPRHTFHLFHFVHSEPIETYRSGWGICHPSRPFTGATMHSVSRILITRFRNSGSRRGPARTRSLTNRVRATWPLLLTCRDDPPSEFPRSTSLSHPTTRLAAIPTSVFAAIATMRPSSCRWNLTTLQAALTWSSPGWPSSAPGFCPGLVTYQSVPENMAARRAASSAARPANPYSWKRPSRKKLSARVSISSWNWRRCPSASVSIRNICGSFQTVAASSKPSSCRRRCALIIAEY